MLEGKTRLQTLTVAPALAWTVVKVQQQHVSYETHHKPRRRFQYSLEFRSHVERIPLVTHLCQVNRYELWRGDSRSIGSRLNTEMIQLRL